MRELSDYLGLTAGEARTQWRQILERVPRKRQEPFAPVEAVLCYGLFYVIDPHRYGGSSMHLAPPVVHSLAELFVRPAGSITNKMMNLDGSRANAGKHEWQFFVEMAIAPEQFRVLYDVAVTAARDLGVGPDQLPDFVDGGTGAGLDLLGQEELSGRTFETVVQIRAAKRRAKLLAASETDTVRMAEQEVRLGQHRFAGQVLEQYAHTCAFCGFSPRSIPRNRLLVASHIKPWAESEDAERLDHRNGIAACPTHDAAFDTGLITVNGGLRVHRAPDLERSTASDAKVDSYFGETLAPSLLIPEDGAGPRRRYLEWHNQHRYQGELVC